MSYEVKSRRRVALWRTHPTLPAGQKVMQSAVFVVLPSGFMAWGFDHEPEVAEARAVARAKALETGAAK